MKISDESVRISPCLLKIRWGLGTTLRISTPAGSGSVDLVGDFFEISGGRTGRIVATKIWYAAAGSDLRKSAAV